MVMELVDTAQEEMNANEFSTNYTEYLDIIEDELLPLLARTNGVNQAVRDLDEKIDNLRDATISPLGKISDSLQEETDEVLADEKALKDLDEKMDQARSRVSEPIAKIVASLNAEMTKADEEFDATRRATVSMSIIISLLGVALAAFAAFLRFHGIAIQGLHTQIDGLQDLHVAHATVDQKALPAVFGSIRGQQVTEQRVPQGSPTIHHEHAAPALGPDGIADQGIVFEALDRDDFTAEFCFTAVISEQRFEHGYFVKKIIADIGH